MQQHMHHRSSQVVERHHVHPECRPNQLIALHLKEMDGEAPCHDHEDNCLLIWSDCMQLHYALQSGVDVHVPARKCAAL